MLRPHHRDFFNAILRCTMCGREILLGEEYWACNGNVICPDCLNAFARGEFAPFRETRGKELIP